MVVGFDLQRGVADPVLGAGTQRSRAVIVIVIVVVVTAHERPSRSAWPNSTTRVISPNNLNARTSLRSARS